MAILGDNLNLGPLGMMGLSILGNAYGPNSRNAIGQGALQGLLMHQQMQGLDQQQKEREMLLEEMRRSRDDSQFLRDTAAQYWQSPAQRALSGGTGPTNEAAAAMPTLKPKFDTEGFLGALSARDPLLAMGMRKSLAGEKPKQHLVDVEDPARPGRTIKRWVREGEASGVDVGAVPQKLPEGMRIGPDGQQQIDPLYLQMRTQIAAAGRAPAQPTPAQIVQTDQGMMMFDPRARTMAPATMPDGTPVKPKLKDIPGTATNAIMENRKALQTIDDAIAGVQGNPDAMGAWNYLGDAVRQRTDPGGVEARGKVAQVGGIRLHDLSGAAVTATELKRLQPYIPTTTDSPEAAAKKLLTLRQEYANMLTQQEAAYAPDQGYRPLPAMQSAYPAAAGNDLAAAARAEMKRRGIIK